MPEDEQPEWAWAVVNVGLPMLDARDAVNLDDFHEDAGEDLDWESLQTALDEWRDKQKTSWYQQTEDRVVFLKPQSEGDPG
jgi:hypothetical protein